MKIKPAKNKVYLKLEVPKVGGLDISSRPTAMEVAEVIDVGEGITEFKKGDKIMVKSWAVDVIDYQDQKYYFIDIDSKGICAIMK